MQGRVRRLPWVARGQSVGVLLMLLEARVRNLALLGMVLVLRGVGQGRGVLSAPLPLVWKVRFGSGLPLRGTMQRRLRASRRLRKC